MRELCQPLVDDITTETETKIRQEIDEVKALSRKRKEQYELDDAIANRQANISDSVLINIRSSDKSTERTIKRPRWKMPRMLTNREDVGTSDSDPVIKRETVRPTALTHLDDADVLDHSTDSEEWDSYKTQFNVDVVAPYNEFVGVGEESLLELLKIHAKNRKDVIIMLEKLRLYSITSVFDHDLLKWIQFAKMLGELRAPL